METTLKRYLIFFGETTATKGGWFDFQGDEDDFAKALEKVSKATCNWWQIIDITTSEMTCGFKE
jgi:hypothetical protein